MAPVSPSQSWSTSRKAPSSRSGWGDEANEGVYDVVEPIEGVRDLCMESHFEYGTRAGWPRIRALLQRYGVPATLNANGRALALSPWLAAEAIADGHEIAAHGWRWERHAHMAQDEERAVIARTVEAITAASGVAPVGWHTRSATSVNTRRLLVEHGRLFSTIRTLTTMIFPIWVEVTGRPHVVLPYAFDTNDMRFQRGGGFVFAEDFARYCIEAFAGSTRRAPRRRMMSGASSPDHRSARQDARAGPVSGHASRDRTSGSRDATRSRALGYCAQLGPRAPTSGLRPPGSRPP
jgi:peptidoglycan/xylan/chitin deacetylase (PgdA/CDA1 family)